MGLSVAALKGRVFHRRGKLQRVLKDGSAMSPLLKRESDLLSEDQSDVEPCLTERGYDADIPTPATAESSSPVLFSTIASRGRQAMNGNGVNDGFENIGGASRARRKVLDLVRIVAPTDSTGSHRRRNRDRKGTRRARYS